MTTNTTDSDFDRNQETARFIARTGRAALITGAILITIIVLTILFE